MKISKKELHTVSPKAGYTQNDVIELSKLMTGWQQNITNHNLKLLMSHLIEIIMNLEKKSLVKIIGR